MGISNLLGDRRENRSYFYLSVISLYLSISLCAIAILSKRRQIDLPLTQSKKQQT